MGKKKKEKAQSINNTQGLKVEIDYDKLAEAIVKAKQIEKQNEEQEKAKKLAEWRATIGYKEHDDKKGLRRTLFRLCNRIKVIFKIMFILRKKHIETSPTKAFIQSLTYSFFNLVKWVLTLGAICFLVPLFYHPNVEYGCIEYIAIIVCGVVTFILSRIFRLMAIEIDQMNDREQVLGIFTAVISIYSLIEKVIEFFQVVG